MRLGAQLCGPDGSLINRDYERAWLPAALGPGDRADVPITITAPAQPGRYTLKFDLVSEGIDWFEVVRVADDDEDAGGDLSRIPSSKLRIPTTPNAQLPSGRDLGLGSWSGSEIWSSGFD